MDVKKTVEQGVEKAKDFNRHPPTWFYFVLFVVVVIGFQLLRHL